MSDDSVNHPKHYNSHPSGIEAIDIVEHLTFNVGNAVKYVFRHTKKGGQTDMDKADWYINREIERLTESEIWRPYPADSRYEASTLGRIRMIGKKTCRKPVPLASGYMTFMTVMNGRRVLHYVHRTVMETFRGPCPDGHEVAHSSGDPAQNALWNLSYKTRYANTQDRVRHRTVNWGDRGGQAKLCAADVEAIRASGDTEVTLSIRFGVSRSQIGRIRRGECWVEPEDEFTALVQAVVDAESNKPIAEAIRLLALAQWSRTPVDDLLKARCLITEERKKDG